MNSITKEFPGVKALDNVNLKVKQGTIHALVGENGAGKSTLMNVLSGIYPFGTYTGDIVYNGEEYKGKHEAIISEEVYHQAMAVMRLLSISSVYTSFPIHSKC